MEEYAELALAMDACADRLEYLNKVFPVLATPTTMDGVAHWRQRREQKPDRDFEDQAPHEDQTSIDVSSVAIDLLQRHSLEDVLELLAENHRVELSLPELIQLIGQREYAVALQRESNELLKNAISFKQIAALWNDLDRPAFGNTAWTSRSISMLAG